MSMNDQDELMAKAEKLVAEIREATALSQQKLDTLLELFGLEVSADDKAKYLQDPREQILPLGSAAAECKGKKAVAVVLPNGERVETSTWRKAVAAIMRDCDADPQRHELLMGLRERVPCRLRQMLLGTPKGMDAPLKINDDLYLESKFDTQALLDNLTQRILRPVGYDCSGVMVLYRDRKIEQATAEPEQDEGPAPPTGLTM